MALTTAQKISLFLIINTPYTGDVDEMYGKHGLSALTYEVSDDGKVQLKILNRLATLTAEEEAVVVQYVDRWQALGTQIYTFDGSIGETSGIAFSPQAEREEIRMQLTNLIPVRHYWDDVKSRAAKNGDVGSISVNAIR